MKQLWFSLLLSLLTLNCLYGLGDTEFTNGLNYYKQEKFLLSIGSFKQALTKGNTNAEIYFYIGNAYLNSEDYDKAIENYGTAFEKALDFGLQAKTAYNMGFTYYVQSDFTNSARYFKMSGELDESIHTSYWLLGMAYYKMLNKEKTISAWEKYVALEPEGEQSDNIRAALEILKSTNFTFEDSSLSNALANATNSSSGSPGTGTGPKNPADLVDISGVLGDVAPDNKGLAEDTELEDLEM